MMGKKCAGVVALVAVFLAARSVSAQLLIDFNSTTQDTGPHPEAGYQSYDAGHEIPADFVTQSYTATTLEGDVMISVTPAWPNTTANTVQQMIDRGAANDANWVGNNLDLLTDWIGSDVRTGGGGNGDWDRTEATTPTYMTLTLGGLPGGVYSWLSYHHDTEHMWTDFQVEISTDGGATFGAPFDLQMTDSTDEGNPASPMTFTGNPDPDPKNLPSTFTTTFTASGSDDVVLRFAPFVDGVDPVAVHKQFFGMNGFELTHVSGAVEVPAASTWALIILALAAFGAGTALIARRRPALAS